MTTDQLLRSIEIVADMLIAEVQNYETQKNQTKRKIWTRNWILRREELGASNNFIREVEEEDKTTFRNHLRLNSEQFEYLLEKVAPKIRKADTQLRKAIPAKVKLQIVLRYLATGDSFRTLESHFRVPKCSISLFLPSVLNAIYDALKEFIQIVLLAAVSWCHRNEDNEIIRKDFDGPHEDGSYKWALQTGGGIFHEQRGKLAQDSTGAPSFLVEGQFQYTAPDGKTWQDMKSKTKKKQAFIRRTLNLTGGGPPPPPLSEHETFVLNMMSDVAVVGHGDSKESVVCFKDVMGPITIEQTFSPMAPASASCVNILEPEVPPAASVVVVENEAAMNLEENMEVSKCNNKPKQKKTMAQKRLQKSIDIAASLVQVLQEKNKIRKDYYNSKIYEIKRQSDAQIQIANSLSRDH